MNVCNIGKQSSLTHSMNNFISHVKFYLNFKLLSVIYDIATRFYTLIAVSNGEDLGIYMLPQEKNLTAL